MADSDRQGIGRGCLMDAQKCECRSGERQSANHKTKNADFISYRQHQATTIAQLALRGHTVKRLGEGFIVSRWGLQRHCPDYAALIAFALQVGVSQ